jgi:DNA invertase Pin-like site-specific DNA recombinase
MLLEHASEKQLGRVYGIYIDDNVSGSAFEREGLNRLKKDISAGRIDLVLLKDLSRLGRNNAKTLQMIDFLEERGVRLLTADGRYDSWWTMIL